MDAGESYLLSLLSFPFICSNYHHCWRDEASLSVMDGTGCRPAGGLSDSEFAVLSTILFWAGETCRKMAATLQVRVCVFSRKDQLISWHWYYWDWLLSSVYDCCPVPQKKRETVIMRQQMKRLTYANRLSEPEKRCRSPARRLLPGEHLTSVITAEDVVPLLHDCRLATEAKLFQLVYFKRSDDILRYGKNRLSDNRFLMCRQCCYYRNQPPGEASSSLTFIKTNTSALTENS